MKQKLDEIRTLAIMLFKAAEAEKRKFPQRIWGRPRTWDDLPSESVAVWDAIAICAYQKLRAKSSRRPFAHHPHVQAVEGDW